MNFYINPTLKATLAIHQFSICMGDCDKPLVQKKDFGN